MEGYRHLARYTTHLRPIRSRGYSKQLPGCHQDTAVRGGQIISREVLWIKFDQLSQLPAATHPVHAQRAPAQRTKTHGGGAMSELVLGSMTAISSCLSGLHISSCIDGYIHLIAQPLFALVMLGYAQKVFHDLQGRGLGNSACGETDILLASGDEPQTNRLYGMTVLGPACIMWICGFTFTYAKGGSYLTNNPAACANCHVMREQYDDWSKSSHRAVATCNDCHTPANVLGKYATKISNGFKHSYYFTVGGFPEPIHIAISAFTILWFVPRTWLNRRCAWRSESLLCALPQFRRTSALTMR